MDTMDIMVMMVEMVIRDLPVTKVQLAIRVPQEKQEVQVHKVRQAVQVLSDPQDSLDP